MKLPLRPETVVFALVVAVLGWWLLDLPPLQRAAATALGLAVFVAASVAIERWRRRYLERALPDEEDDAE